MGNLADFGSSVTALAGGGRTGVVPLLVYGVNRIATCATLGDSVQLPPALPQGSIVRVINKGAQPCQVFGNIANGDTINGIATATGVSQAPGQIVDYVSSVASSLNAPSNAVSGTTVAGNWEAFVAAFGNALGSTITISGDATINAHTAAAYKLTKGSAAAITLGAPTTGTDDDLEIEFVSNSAFAHVITATGLLLTGAAAVNTATCAAQKGCSLKLRAVGAKWTVVYSNGITFA